MVATITLNPVATTVAPGSFNVSSEGYIQGTVLQDPPSRNWLAGGVLAQSETIPMWGGVGISETTTPASGAGVTAPQGNLGGNITRATTLTATSANGLTGFSVFDQNHAMMNTPQSPVPLSGSGMMVNFYRLGSLARIIVACDPALVSLDGNIISQQVSWDFNNQRLQPFVASTPTEAVTSIAWANTNGGRGTVVMGVPSQVGAVGDAVNISGATNTGTGGAAAVNGNFIVDTFTDASHFTIAMPAAAGVIGTIAGTILLNVGTGALACKILDVNIGNSMIVVFNPVTGFATWNRSGSAAVILI